MGKRGCFASYKQKALALIGVIFIFVGLANFATYHELTPTSRVAYKAQFLLFSDLRVWGSLFMLAGLIGVVAAFLRQYMVGFSAMMLMSTWWGALFVSGLTLTGYIRIIPSILIWFLISVFLYIIAAWPEFPSENMIAMLKEENAHEE